MFFVLHFPIYSMGLYPLVLPSIITSKIMIHIHKLQTTTVKFTNFLSVMINYKLQFYNSITTPSGRAISLINKSNKKQRPQKGLGRARVGSLKSAVHRGGGVIFGPRPRALNLKINTKEWSHIYKSIIINKRSCILWFFINKPVWCSGHKNVLKMLIRHLGISYINRINVIVLDKLILYKQNFQCQSISNIKLLDLLNTQYIIYLL